MKLYILSGRGFTTQCGEVSAMYQCAKSAISKDPELSLKMYRLRGGDKTARIIAEIKQDELIPIVEGDLFDVRGLLQD